MTRLVGARRAGALAAALAGSAVLAPAALPAQAGAPDLYERIDKRLAADPSLAAALGKPAPEMADVAWLVGEWDVEAAVAGGGPPERGTSRVTPLYRGAWLEIRDDYPNGVQDLGYLGFSPAARRWTSVSLDSYGNANIFAAQVWDGGKLVLEGDALILGIEARLRQTLTREGANAYRVDNEEWIDGAWKLLDSYRYTRKPR